MMDQIKDTFVRLIIVLFVTFVGMICGAVIIYFLAGFIYLAFYGSGPVMDSYECARGMAVGYLSIFTGGLLGAALGYVKSHNYVKSFEPEGD